MKRYLFIIILGLISYAAVAQADFYSRLADSAKTLTLQCVRYNPSYFSIGYPNGDVPANYGVCTDVVIRAYRKMGIDLQKEVHEDMKTNFASYPNYWGLKTTDRATLFAGT